MNAEKSNYFDHIIVGSEKVFLVEDVEVFSDKLNNSKPQVLDGDDFLVFPKIRKTDKMSNVEGFIEDAIDLPNYLFKQYYINNMSSWSIGFELGISSDTVRCWMRKYGMALRSNEESKTFSK